MIIDSLQNTKWYSFPQKLHAALKFLSEAENKEAGKYPLNDGIFALVQEYTTKPQSECIYETHQRYIDIQYIVEGTEKMGIAFSGQTTKAYDTEKDIEFFDCNGFLIDLHKQDFALLFPQDFHQPKVGNGSFVKKVVVKVPVEIFN